VLYSRRMIHVRPALGLACLGVALLAACGAADRESRPDIETPKGFEQIAAESRVLPWPTVTACPDLQRWGSLTSRGAAGRSSGGYIICDYQFSNDAPLFGVLASRYGIPSGHDQTTDAQVDVVRLTQSLAATRAGLSASLTDGRATSGNGNRARLIDPSGLPAGSYYFAGFSHDRSTGSNYSCSLAVPMETGALSIVATTRVPRPLAGADVEDWCLVARVVAFELD
jgi:hypothetical protein